MVLPISSLFVFSLCERKNEQQKEDKVPPTADCRLPTGLCDLKDVAMRAYLDIETTFSGSISMIGIYRPDIGTIQLVAGGVRGVALYEALVGVATVLHVNR